MDGLLFPQIEPDVKGLLDVGDNNRVYWEICGKPSGKPALVLHGGPGSGCMPWHRRLFNPEDYRIVLLDQRNCGRSKPHASERSLDLRFNTTQKLVEDIESLRRFLGIERWLVLGGSWGSALALAYAQSFPNHVTEMILFGVTLARRKEFDWLFRGGLAILFPREWQRLQSWLPAHERTHDIVDDYHSLLNSMDSRICDQAALEWCLWESATPEWPPREGLADRFGDPAYRLAFSRIVTQYVRNDAWFEDGILLRNVHKLESIPGVLIGGRLDFQAPIGNAWELNQAWKNSKLVILNDAGHSVNNSIEKEIIGATASFAKL